MCQLRQDLNGLQSLVPPLLLHRNKRMGLGAGLLMQREMDDLTYLLEKRFLSEERRNGPKQVTLLRDPS